MTVIEVIFIDPDGREYRVGGEEGRTLMSIAVEQRVPGILAECGGACACATCHVKVSPLWMATLPEPDAMESGLLCGAIEPTRESRLACQIVLTAELNGLIVNIPTHQI